METKSKFTELINGSTPVLVDFFAEWCGPCKVMAPVLAELKKNLADKLTIVKVDVDKNPSVSAAFGIQGVPTLLLFKEGQIRWRQSGVISISELSKAINAHS